MQRDPLMKVSCCRFQKLILEWSLMQLHYKRQKVRALFFPFCSVFLLWMLRIALGKSLFVAERWLRMHSLNEQQNGFLSGEIFKLQMCICERVNKDLALHSLFLVIVSECLGHKFLIIHLLNVHILNQPFLDHVLLSILALTRTTKENILLVPTFFMLIPNIDLP